MESWISIAVGVLSLASGIFFHWSSVRPRSRRYMRILAARIAVRFWFALVFLICLWILGRYAVGQGVPSRMDNITAMLYTCILFLYALMASLGPAALKGAKREEVASKQLLARVAALEASAKASTLPE